MAVYGIIVLITVIVFLTGLVCGYQLVKYGLNLGLKLNRYTDTGELIIEESVPLEQEMTE